jgi:hypothetical protein
MFLSCLWNVIYLLIWLLFSNKELRKLVFIIFMCDKLVWRQGLSWPHYLALYHLFEFW